jgi:hypothetical protein
MFIWHTSALITATHSTNVITTQIYVPTACGHQTAHTRAYVTLIWSVDNLNRQCHMHVTDLTDLCDCYLNNCIYHVRQRCFMSHIHVCDLN